MVDKTSYHLTTSPSKVTREGEKIYQEKLKSELEPELKGRFVVIEPESGDYFVAADPTQANKKARRKYPDKLFYLKKIGFEAAFRLPIASAATFSLAR